MEAVEVRCDRCGKMVNGFEEPNVATSGFYYVCAGWWDQFARPGETIVCDACMWADPKYQAIYGIYVRDED